MMYNFFFFFFECCRRDDDLDVEVLVSGFIKEMVDIFDEVINYVIKSFYLYFFFVL